MRLVGHLQRLEEAKIDIDSFKRGKEAFKKGINCAPILDKEFFDKLPEPKNKRFEMMNSWTKGWIQASLD
jgi:hypothetical protein